MRRLPLHLPPGSTLYGDKGYQDQKEEVLLREAGEIRFVPLRRTNSKPPLPQCTVFLAHCRRQQVETAFSLLDAKMPRHIHAVSQKGFWIKLQAAIIAYAFDRFLA